MDAFTFERKSPIAFFTLNRPEKYNAITPGLMREMESSMMEFMEDKSLRVGIITGAGNKAFCSGADIVEWLPFVKETASCPWRVPRTPMRGLQLTKPLIAAVNGIAYGGGAEVALACDFRIAAENASFRFPEPSLGILPRLGGTQRLPRLIGYAHALEIMLTNEKIDAQKALSIGLVNKVVPQEQLLESAIELAQKICKLAPLAVTAIKRCIMEGYDLSLEDGLALENEIGLTLYKTKDYEEGRAAFREKRTAVFKGE
ncbi:enoyl-CoA hydratase/isomerase family protein [Pyramidobacter piscolens]|uniref:enoyl-CoA hydratase/isomerase family protein n=1 Tax=Pyramidobacter piscolens TaxID=638849 RepID=UPI00266646B4|nr:enoyl-CoA hydratase-related protein [Pyramidobacter piscolens]